MKKNEEPQNKKEKVIRLRCTIFSVFSPLLSMLSLNGCDINKYLRDDGHSDESIYFGLGAWSMIGGGESRAKAYRINDVAALENGKIKESLAIEKEKHRFVWNRIVDSVFGMPFAYANGVVAEEQQGIGFWTLLNEGHEL